MIDLYTWTTPNGRKISIMLEETGLQYRVIPVNLGKEEQMAPAFTALNPNQKIPTIVDHDVAGGPLAIFESGAILIHLAEKTGRFLPKDVRARAATMQWLMFQMSHVGPMIGQAGHFLNQAPEKIPYAIQRFIGESVRILKVLEAGLRDKEYLAADYSIADIATWAWVYGYKWSGVSIDGLEHLERWIDVIGKRPAVRRGKDIPEPTDIEEMIRKADESTAKVRGILA